MDNQNQVSQNLPPNPIEPLEENKIHSSFLTNKLFLTILAILILSTFIYAGIYFGLNSKSNQITKSNPSPTTVLQPSKTPTDETANWKLYVNQKYGFEIMHPSDVTVTVGSHIPPHGTDLILPNDNYIESDVKITSTKSSIEIILSIFQKSMPNLERYILDEVKREKEFNQANPSNSVSISYSKITINSIPAYKIYYTYPSSSQIPATRIYLQNSKHLYLFGYNDRRYSNIPREYPDQSLIASRIISTFKFSDQNQTNSTLLNLIQQFTLKDIKWQDQITEGSNNYINRSYGETIKGSSITGFVTTNDTSRYIGHFEKVDELAKLGWQEDIKQDADGPGSSVWGYIKSINGKNQILQFSYQNKSMQPAVQGGMEEKCPCTLEFTVFLSDDFF